MIQTGDVVEVQGQLKKVVDFLATADKETLRLLSSFFQDEASGISDAKKLRKPCRVKTVYKAQGNTTIEVELSKDYLWEEKDEYFRKVDLDEEKSDAEKNESPLHDQRSLPA